MTARASRCIGLTAVAALIITLVWTLAQLHAVNLSKPSAQGLPLSHADSLPYPSPLKREVIGLVFFGRREFVRMLDCYLKVCCCFVPLPFRTTHFSCPSRLYAQEPVALVKQLT